MQINLTLVFALLIVQLIIIIIIGAVVMLQNRKIMKLQHKIREISDNTIQSHNQDMHYIEEKIDDLALSFSTESARMNDSLRHTENAILAVISQISQSQNGLLESIQRQLINTGRNQEERLGDISRTISEQMAQLSVQTEQTKEWLTKAMFQLRQENTQQLNEIRGTVDEKLTSALDKKLSDSFAQVSTRLEQVYKGLGEMQTLANGVGDLKKVLTNVKTRGIWGEMQVDAIIRQVLSPNQYDTNVAVVKDSQERVEFAIRLPGKNGDTIYLPIDSKFPQEDYLRLTGAAESGDSAAIDSSRKALIQRIKLEGKRISDKYIHPPYTTDFAIMFLPVEGLYAEVVQLPGLVEELQNSLKVVVAGPSTFSALLNALQMGFRTLAIEQRTSEVWEILGLVKADFAKFSDTLAKTKQKLQQASDSLDAAYSRTVSMQRRLGSVETANLENDDKYLE